MGNQPDAGDGGGKTPTVESLSEQIENLNKGIGKYRDDAVTAAKEAAEAKADAKSAREEAASVKKAIEESKDSDDDEDIKLSPADQKKLDAWAKSKGYVTKEEAEQKQNQLQADSLKTIESTAVDEFLKSHPTINNDDEWKKIAAEFNLYKQPTSLTGYRQLLNKIYKELYGGEEKTARARAEIENRKRLSLGGGSQKEEDHEAVIEQYIEKYPNLSREQIESRLEEINQLAEDRAKKKASRKN